MVNMIKRTICIFLIFTLIYSVYGNVAEVDINAFITKAELNTLKKSYQNKITNLYARVDETIDSNTINYLSNNVASTRVVCPYPIGAVYISINDVNPEVHFGGTWEKFGQGKTLVGYSESDTDFNEVLKTGGEKNHSMVVEELPSHSHTYSCGSWGSGKYTEYDGEHDHEMYVTEFTRNDNTNRGNYYMNSFSSGGTTHWVAEAGEHYHYYTPAGRILDNERPLANVPFSLLQPYIVVSFWRRVA